MTVRVDSEEVQTTTSEKVLALVLAIFIAVGGIWGYFKLNDIDPASSAGDLYGYEQAPVGTAADRTALSQRQKAVFQRNTAQRQVEKARQNLELTREAFRTAIEAGDPATAPEQAYRDAEAAFAEAGQQLEDANARVAAAEGPAAAAEARIQQVQKDLDEERRVHDRKVFIARLVYVLAMLGGFYWLLGRMRRSRSRYLPVALAGIGAAALTALVMASDYTTDYIDFQELGPLAISLGGVAMTMVAFVALQRYLAKQVPIRRVRKHECPFCGFPVRGNANCEGCGRRVAGECSTCHQPRRVGTQHCGSCGAA